MNSKYIWIGITVAIVIAIVGTFTGGKTLTQVIKETTVGGATNYGTIGLFDSSTDGGSFGITGGSVAFKEATSSSIGCSFLSPNKISYITNFQFIVNATSSVASEFRLATSTSAVSTTTGGAIIARWLGTSKNFDGVLMGSTTVLTAVGDNILKLPPSTYVNFEWAKASGYINEDATTGYCGIEMKYIDR